MVNSDDDDVSSSVWELHRSGQRTQMNYSENISKDDGSEEEEFVTYHVSQLTLSPENTLFHYIHLDVGEGIFLAPLNTNDRNVRASSHLHEELLDSFRNACLTIHSTFQMSLKAREMMRNTPQQQQKEVWLNKSLPGVKEQGLLFQWAPKVGDKALPLLSYWVSGRLFLGPNPRECYVCYHDSAPQNMVELAFRLAMGIQL